MKYALPKDLRLPTKSCRFTNIRNTIKDNDNAKLIKSFSLSQGRALGYKLPGGLLLVGKANIPTMRYLK